MATGRRPPGRGAKERGGERPLIVKVTLGDHWYEEISRKEALRRLETRKLDPEGRKRIEQSLPELTKHYLAVHGNALLEYADFGDGIAHLLLLLRADRIEKKKALLVHVPN